MAAINRAQPPTRPQPSPGFTFYSLPPLHNVALHLRPLGCIHLPMDFVDSPRLDLYVYLFCVCLVWNFKVGFRDRHNVDMHLRPLGCIHLTINFVDSLRLYLYPFVFCLAWDFQVGFRNRRNVKLISIHSVGCVHLLANSVFSPLLYAAFNSFVLTFA